MLARRRIVLVALSPKIRSGLADAPAAKVSPSGDSADWLARVPRLEVVGERPALDPAYRVLGFVDEYNPVGGTFQQRLPPARRSADVLMVPDTTGCFVSAHGTLSEPVRISDANQQALDERFFGLSQPRLTLWSTLDPSQVATGHHRIDRGLASLCRAIRMCSPATAAPTRALPSRFAPGARDSYRCVAGSNNRRVTITAIKPSDQTTSTATIQRWAGC